MKGKFLFHYEAKLAAQFLVKQSHIILYSNDEERRRLYERAFDVAAEFLQFAADRGFIEKLEEEEQQP